MMSLGTSFCEFFKLISIVCPDDVINRLAVCFQHSDILALKTHQATGPHSTDDDNIRTKTQDIIVCMTATTSVFSTIRLHGPLDNGPLFIQVNDREEGGSSEMDCYHRPIGIIGGDQ